MYRLGARIYASRNLGGLEFLLLLLSVLAKIVYCGRSLLKFAQSGREVPKLFSEGTLTVSRGVEDASRGIKAFRTRIQ